MASLFVKGMIGVALDEATERNRRRDAASEAMTNLAIDNINEARKIQAEREQEIKARENKANRISKQLGIDMSPLPSSFFPLQSSRPGGMRGAIE